MAKASKAAAPTAKKAAASTASSSKSTKVAEQPAKEASAPRKAAASKTPVKEAPAKSAAKSSAASGKTPAKAAPAKSAATKAPAAKSAAAKVAPAAEAPAAETAPAPVAKAPAPARAATKPAPAKAEPPKQVKTYEPKFVEKQKALLETERASYVASAEELKAEADQMAAEMEPGDIQFDDESGEGDTMAVDRERDLMLSAQARAVVEEIDRALSKINRGSYGACEKCGNLIPKPRLEAIPHASLCVDCKQGGLSRR